MEKEYGSKIFKMINELEKRGFRVIKITECMEKAVKECEEMDIQGESKDCFCCQCSLCLFQI